MRKRLFHISLLCFCLIISVRCDTYDFPDAPYPRIETLSVTNISRHGVMFHAKIDLTGDQPIINHGFVWGLQDRFLISNAEKIELGPVSNPHFVHTFAESPFYARTTYYVRAFVQNESYVVYGAAVPFQGGM